MNKIAAFLARHKIKITTHTVAVVAGAVAGACSAGHFSWAMFLAGLAK